MAGMFDTGANALLNIGQNTVQPQTDLLQNIAAAQGIKNQALAYQNELTNYKSKQAIGNALSRHVRRDGSIDYGAAISDAAQNPDAAYGLPDAVTQNNIQQAQNIGNQNAQLGLNQRRTGMLAGLAAPLMSKPNVTKGDVARQLGVGVAHGLITMDQAQSAYSALPNDSDGIKQQVRGLMDASIGPEHSYNDAYGNMQMVDDGGVLRWENVGSPASGQGGVQVGAGVEKQVSPDSNATLTPVTIKDPETGQMITVYRPAGELRHPSGGGNFTGRRIDTSGGGSSEPMAGAPAGYNEQYKTGQDMQNALAAQQNDVTQNIATLRNLDALLSSPELKNVRSRTLKDIANNASKFGIDWGGSKGYATIAQEIDKAGTTLRKQMMDGGGGPHTNAGLSDLEHITPGIDMTPTAARALTNEMLTAALYQQRRQKIAAGEKDPTKVLSTLADYDQNFDPRFATIQRLGPEEGREYAKSHISDQREYADAVRRMARAQREKGYDYGLTPQQVDRILGLQNGR